MVFSVRKEVYDKLKKATRPDESFSDAIECMLGNDSNVQAFLDLNGIAKNPDQVDFRTACRERKRQVRESLNNRFKAKEDTMGGET